MLIGKITYNEFPERSIIKPGSVKFSVSGPDRNWLAKTDSSKGGLTQLTEWPPKGPTTLSSSVGSCGFMV
jgi:hypothetical protein